MNKTKRYGTSSQKHAQACTSEEAKEKALLEIKEEEADPTSELSKLEEEGEEKAEAALGSGVFSKVEVAAAAMQVGEGQ